MALPGDPGDNSSQATTAEKVASFLDNFDWTLGDTQSSYVPQEYIHPWEREGWGTGDISITPREDRPITIPIKTETPRIQPGQRDYVYMPTKKEQRRDQLEEIKHRDDVMGRDWREVPLPRGNDDIAWSGGSRDFDERSGTYRPGHRSEESYEYQPTEKETERRGMKTSATRSLRDELMADMGDWR